MRRATHAWGGGVGPAWGVGVAERAAPQSSGPPTHSHRRAKKALRGRIRRHCRNSSPGGKMTVATSSPSPAVHVERWPSEIPLLVLVILASASLWLLLAVSLIGLLYVALIGAFLFFLHVGFVAFVRGSGVRLGPDQFPELHGRVVELARRA